MSTPGSLTPSSPSSLSSSMQHFLHPSYLGQSISLCPGMLQRHLLHQLEICSAWWMHAILSLMIALPSMLNHLKMHLLGKCRWLLQWWQYFLTAFFLGHLLWRVPVHDSCSRGSCNLCLKEGDTQPVEFVGPQQPNGEMAQWGNMAQRGNGPRGKVWVHTRKWPDWGLNPGPPSIYWVL